MFKDEFSEVSSKLYRIGADRKVLPKLLEEKLKSKYKTQKINNNADFICDIIEAIFDNFKDFEFIYAYYQNKYATLSEEIEKLREQYIRCYELFETEKYELESAKAFMLEAEKPETRDAIRRWYLYRNSVPKYEYLNSYQQTEYVKALGTVLGNYEIHND